jgi:hypothetical protein
MNMKTCLDCKTEYTDVDSKNFGRCPQCDSKFYTVATDNVRSFPLKTFSEIEEEKRVKLDESINPEILKKFKNRLNLELEEIAYQEWRAMQPEWKSEVARAESNPKSQANIGGFASSHAGATALGVFVGTTAIRAQLADINENQNDDSGGDSGEAEGGMFDSLGDFF